MKNVILSALISAACAFSSSHSSAAQFDVYRFKITNGFPIRSTCNHNGSTRTSSMKMYLPQNLTGQEEIVMGLFKVRVCASFVGFQKENIDTVFPIADLENVINGPRGAVRQTSFSTDLMANYFGRENSPNRVFTKKTKESNSSMTIEMNWHRGSRKILGPIEVQLVDNGAIRADGYNAEIHWPISEIKVPVPNRDLTLKSKIESLSVE